MTFKITRALQKIRNTLREAESEIKKSTTNEDEKASKENTIDKKDSIINPAQHIGQKVAIQEDTIENDPQEKDAKAERVVDAKAGRVDQSANIHTLEEGKGRADREEGSDTYSNDEEWIQENYEGTDLLSTSSDTGLQAPLDENNLPHISQLTQSSSIKQKRDNFLALTTQLRKLYTDIPILNLSGDCKAMYHSYKEEYPENARILTVGYNSYVLSVIMKSSSIAILTEHNGKHLEDRTLRDFLPDIKGQFDTIDSLLKEGDLTINSTIAHNALTDFFKTTQADKGESEGKDAFKHAVVKSIFCFAGGNLLKSSLCVAQKFIPMAYAYLLPKDAKEEPIVSRVDINKSEFDNLSVEEFLCNSDFLQSEKFVTFIKEHGEGHDLAGAYSGWVAKYTRFITLNDTVSGFMESYTAITKESVKGGKQYNGKLKNKALEEDKKDVKYAWYNPAGWFFSAEHTTQNHNDNWIARDDKGNSQWIITYSIDPSQVKNAEEYLYFLQNNLLISTHADFIFMKAEYYMQLARYESKAAACRSQVLQRMQDDHEVISFKEGCKKENEMLERYKIFQKTFDFQTPLDDKITELIEKAQQINLVRTNGKFTFEPEIQLLRDAVATLSYSDISSLPIHDYMESDVQIHDYMESDVQNKGPAEIEKVEQIETDDL